jgi:hypothetical protein
MESGVIKQQLFAKLLVIRKSLDSARRQQPAATILSTKATVQVLSVTPKDRYDAGC